MIVRPRHSSAAWPALAVWALVLLTIACRPGGSKAAGELAGVTQFVANGSFEEMDGTVPRGWTSRSWQRDGDAVFAVGPFAAGPAARSGERCVMISSEKGVDASWAATVPIRPYFRYRLSGWIRTEGLLAGSGRGAQINVDGEEEWRTPPVTGTRDWTRVEVEFEAGANDALEVTCLFGGWGRSSGRAWFDDIELVRLSGRELGQPSVTIDGDKTAPPMSKYIYGQFIEHLGRCIYQGLWAEMLEDRKFFWPVGEGESPWKAVGSAGQVRMDTVKPFTGAHTPRLALTGKGPGGIAQDGLALVAGREYAGRVVLAGDAAAAPVSVSLVWGDAPEARLTIPVESLGRAYGTFPFAFKAGASTENGRLEIVSSGRGAFAVGAVSIMPADNVQGFRPEVLALLKELDAPVYRWPGGNFVSGYDWRDGIGDRDRRPPRKNPAWTGVEHNDVGLHEYMDLMRLIGAEPYVTVNSGLGDAAMALEELEYANGAPDTKMGRLRAANGHPQPWGVKLWAIGNEMYGDWQLGHMPLSDYVKKHVQYAVSMKALDPSIRVVAVGAVGRWSETMLAEASNHMDLISEHFYVQHKPGLLSHVSQMPAAIRRIAEAHRKYRSEIPTLMTHPVPVALDEWNYWYGPDIYGEIGTQYFLEDALGVAAAFNEYARQTDVYAMANYAQTVNVIGAIKTSKTAAVLDSTGVILALYRRHFGTIPVAVGGAPEPLDVMACWRDDAKTVLTLSIVNPTRRPMELRLDAGRLKLPQAARLFLVDGPDPRACNVPGKEPQVAVRETAAAPFGRAVTVPPISVSLYEIEIPR
ncbi:MAG TPA: alpha-L-arabinofuranosidase C-terminal domain-containing protein [Candidatus Aminicenantes bacterium]|nr:alpha-L-arabinofuranosidase C-terminal domain-containing protein [Candidatus Aminicenantes bacterium]HRY63865.1 alpha-L-arabinofuranosidase C-terminal domain-containing protein [Candidatus Aminicenantes bacterium]HRZ70778.1 alpha-L-arabinofuranosidase C-terminal domain-containing protein [Candidatus Aminicenantes bacterium]